MNKIEFLFYIIPLLDSNSNLKYTYFTNWLISLPEHIHTYYEFIQK